MEIKKCTKCRENKSLDNFYKRKKSSDGLMEQCIPCKKETDKNYYYKNQQKIKLKTKLYYELNKDIILENSKERYNINKEEINNNQKESYQKNREYRLEYQKQYNKQNVEKIKKYKILNKEKIREYNKEWNKKNLTHNILYRRENIEKIKNRIKNRYKNDFMFKLKSNIRSLIYSSLKKKGFQKQSKTQEIIGCLFKEFKNYLENQFLPEMNWDNYGEIWEIDHIIPISSAKTEDEIYKLNHFSNLQPLFKTTQIAESFGYTDQIGNRNKSNKIEEEISKNII